MQKVISNLGKKANIGEISPHILRHTFAITGNTGTNHLFKVGGSVQPPFIALLHMSRSRQVKNLYKSFD